MPPKDDFDQLAAYVYYKVWENVLLNMFPVNEEFSEEFIKVNIDGFEGNFSIDDLIPTENEDGIFALIDSGDEKTEVKLLKCVGDEFVQVKNDYVDC